MNIYIIYVADDQTVNETHVYVVKSNDDGLTWDAPTQLSVDPVMQGFDPRTFLSENGGVLYVEWNDEVGDNIKIT
mgnify:CR=1 FL=1